MSKPSCMAISRDQKTATPMEAEILALAAEVEAEVALAGAPAVERQHLPAEPDLTDRANSIKLSDAIKNYASRDVKLGTK